MVEEEIHKTIRAKKERRLENKTSDEATKFRKRMSGEKTKEKRREKDFVVRGGPNVADDR